MKCDELKAFRALNIDEDETGMAYPKAAVDAAIAELKVENRRLKKDLYKTDHHNIQYLCSMYGCENVEAFHGEIKNLQTKLIATERALWLARAERAVAEQTVDEWSRYKEKHPFGSWREDSFEYWVQAWIYVENLCRKKAKEYK